jgi:RNA polymerase-binding transcription factor DksA
MVRREEVKKALSRLIEEQTADHRLISNEDLRDAFNHAEREISAQTHYLLLERKSEELQKIESLIKRLAEKNDYGRCEECGKHIPEARLLIVPDATLCVPCQRQLEKQHSGKGLPRSSYIFAGKHDALDWERDEGAPRCRETPLTIETDMDHLSFPDMDEMDIEDGTPESGEES